MPKDTSARPDQALRETEEAAYHAFREWPVLLALRQKELEARQIVPTPNEKPEQKEASKP